MTQAIFLSDVHLDPAAPARTKRFLGFLDRIRERRPPHLFILGDLFHYWVGPGHARLPDYRPVLEALRRTVAAGIRIVFFHGNRDFHVNETFRRDLGIRVVPDALEVGIGSGRTLYLAHGDLLCARDHRYRHMRHTIRSDLLVGLYRAMPLWMSLGIANWMRRMSKKEVSRKRGRDLQLSVPEVARILSLGPVAAILGHVHRAEIQRLTVEGEKKYIVTLGAWEEGTSHLELTGKGLTLYEDEERVDRIEW